MKTLIITESTQNGTDKKFLESLIKCRSLLSNFMFLPKGSISKVLEYIEFGLNNEAMLTDPQTKIKTLLIIIDANSKPQERFKQVIDAFNSISNFSLPEKPGVISRNSSKKFCVGIFLFPDNQHPGSLETLCTQALKHQKLTEKNNCIRRYFGGNIFYNTAFLNQFIKHSVFSIIPFH